MGSSGKRIGILVNDANSDYVGEVIDGIFSVCSKERIPLMIFSVGELDYCYRPFDYHQKAIAGFCSKKNVDGLVVCSSVFGNNASKERIEKFVKEFSFLPTVSLGAGISGIPSVLCDARSGMESLLNDIVCRRARKKFCVLGKILGSAEAQERTEIISNFLRNKGLRFDQDSIIGGNFTYEGAMKCLEEYWAKNGSFDFDAVMALNDDMAFAALDFCAVHGIKVPDSVCVAGFDDVRRAEISNPPLATVNQRLFDQGKKAAEILLDLINGFKSAGLTFVQSEAMLRRSCGFSPAQELSFGSQFAGRVFAAEWLEKKRQFHIMNDFLAHSQEKLNLAKFRKSFKGFAERFGIEAAAVCVYDEPMYINGRQEKLDLPDKAYVLSSYDNAAGLDQDLSANPPPFNPREEILPKGFVSSKTGVYSVWILSNCETQYGYLVFRKGACESLMYSMMCQSFSRLLSSAWEGSKAEKEARAQQERTARLNMISNTDELTGLLNRRGLLELGQQTIDIAVVLNQGGVVIFGDMDGLKRINDTYGHDAGDRAIKAEAEILKKNFRASDIVGRIGGDEFVVVASGLGEPRLAAIRENVEAECKAWNITHNEEFEISISMGCKAFDKESHSLEDILREADGLLYEEKRKKKNSRKN